MSDEELREAIKDTLFLYGIRGEELGSLRPGSVADALLPVVRRYADQRAAEELRAATEELWPMNLGRTATYNVLKIRADALTREATT